MLWLDWPWLGPVKFPYFQSLGLNQTHLYGAQRRADVVSHTT